MPLEPTKISAATEIDAIADGDEFPLVDVSGATPALKKRKGTFAKVATWILAKFPVPSQATVEAGLNTTPGLITSQRIKQAIVALGLASPMTTAGDLIIGGASGAATRLGIGANGKILGVAEGAIAWIDAPEGSSGPLNNFTATTDPGTGDDSGDGYAVGSTWINVTLDRIWRCTDATLTAALWERVDQEPGTLNNFAATTNPGVGDDSGDGYSVGSRWVNLTLDTSWTCTDASVGAAVWSQDNASSGSSLPVADTTALAMDPSDNTKRVRLDAGEVQAGATRAIQVPNGDCRVRDNLVFNVIGPTVDWDLSDLFLWVVPAAFQVERVFVSSYAASGVLESPVCEITKNGAELTGNISLGTNNSSGTGRHGLIDGPFNLVSGDVLQATILNTGAGSAGTPAEGMQVNLTGFWTLV